MLNTTRRMRIIGGHGGVGIPAAVARKDSLDLLNEKSGIEAAIIITWVNCTTTTCRIPIRSQRFRFILKLKERFGKTHR